MPTAKRIAVVGAGMSGLTCAYELQKAGHDVTVFEATHRVGGRMGTRVKDGFYFDTGTNFFVGAYTHTKALCEELGIGDQFQPMTKARHGLFRHGQIHWLSLEPKHFFSAYSFLSFREKLRFLAMAAIVYCKFPGTDFFDLSNNPVGMDTMSAYAFARRWGGKEVADVLIDGYTATYEFHDAKAISVTGLIALFGLMLKNKDDFAMWHTAGGEMQVLPDALAKKLNVRLNSSVQSIRHPGPDQDPIIVRATDSSQARMTEIGYDAVVLATTADVAKKIYLNPTSDQAALLDRVHYSSTITLSFRVPLECVQDLAIVTVPHAESAIISSYSNESTKGTIVNGQTLVNVWIWDDSAPELLKKTDEEIFEIVKKELIRVCPPFQRHPGPDQDPIVVRATDSGQARMTNDADVIPHDLQRLPVSMPKYEHGYITQVAEFWNNGQGDNNVWCCGDYLNAPWVEGSVRCGQKVAKRIIDLCSPALSSGQ